MDVIHLVAKIGDATTTNDANVNANTSPQQQQQNQPMFQHALITTSFSRERRLRQQDAAVLTVDKQQVFETIHQSILAINNILECDDHFNCFNINKRKLVLGQWIDVKDTVYEWLEAEVIDINEEKKEVYVHYNGWGARWDEWLPMDSDRIMPFRFHTRQLTALHTLSPYPNKPLLEGIKLVTDKEEEEGFDGMVSKTINIMEVCLEQMKNVIKCKDGKDDSNGNGSGNESGDVKKDEKEIQLDYYYKIKKILPLLDRTGRLMTDLSVYANECVKPSNLKDLNRGLYRSNNKMERQKKESDVNINDNNNNNVQGANFQKQLEDITHTNTNTNTTTNSNSNENKNESDDSILNDMLKGYTDDSIKNTTLEFLNTLPSRERRSTRYLPARNKFDELFKNQIPLNDLPAFINHYHSVLSRPLYDIYVHEIPQSTYEALNALSNNRTNEANTNTATTTNNENTNQFFRDSSTEQQQQQQQQPNTTPNIQNETNNECPVGISGQNVNDTNTISNNIENNNETTINTNELDDIIVEDANNNNNTNNNTNEQSDNIDKDK